MGGEDGATFEGEKVEGDAAEDWLWGECVLRERLEPPEEGEIPERRFVQRGGETKGLGGLELR